MQLQIEYNHAPFQQQSCLICNRLYEMAEAKILVCNERGEHQGEVCPKCLRKGFDWLSDRFEQIAQPKRKITLRQSRSLEIPIGA
jgi:hypothetical protein